MKNLKEDWVSPGVRRHELSRTETFGRRWPKKDLVVS